MHNSSWRDRRHIDKASFILSESPFYDSVDSVPEVSDLYSSILRGLRAELRADSVRFMRDGIWWHALTPLSENLPTQGWKIHLSARFERSTHVLEKAARVLIPQLVPFKVVLDERGFELLNSKRAQRGSSGKFVTVYPASRAQFLRLMQELDGALSGESGPDILTDAAFGESGVVYYRYGGIRPDYELDVRGTRTPVLRSPEGAVLPDDRTPCFVIPGWEETWWQANLSDDAVEELMGDSEDETDVLLGGRYVVEASLQHSNMGGVYKGIDIRTGGAVVLKEARPNTCTGPMGGDAFGILEREASTLNALQSIDGIPQLIDLFEQETHRFLVREFVPGIDLRTWVLARSPLFRVGSTEELSLNFRRAWRCVLSDLCRLVEAIHATGFVVGDLSSSNLLVLSDDDHPDLFSVSICDFDSCRPAESQSPVLFTPGFRNPNLAATAAATKLDDGYAISMVAVSALLPTLANLNLISQPGVTSGVQTISRILGWPDTVPDWIVALRDGDASIDEFREAVQNDFQAGHCRPIGSPLPQASRPDLNEVVEGMARFLFAEADPANDRRLFGSDPFMFETNPISFGFGAGGVLYALHECGYDIPTSMRRWFERGVEALSLETVPSGLLTGFAGIAVVLQRLGYDAESRRIFELAVRHPLLEQNVSLFYGTAGVALAGLRLYEATGSPRYLVESELLGQRLASSARRTETGVCWDDPTTGHPNLGFGYGQSGIALVLHALGAAASQDLWTELAHEAVRFDLAAASEIEPGVLSLPNVLVGTRPTYEQYLEEGSAGLLRVLARLDPGNLDAITMLTRDVARNVSVFPGWLYGLAGMADTLHLAAHAAGLADITRQAAAPLEGLLDLYVLRTQSGFAVPGEHLLRLSCDYGTGVAGVMHTLHRIASGQPSHSLFDGDDRHASPTGTGA